jgi:hypothetical protein
LQFNDVQVDGWCEERVGASDDEKKFLMGMVTADHNMKDDMQNIPQPTITPRTNVANLKAQIDSLSTKDNNALIEMMGSTQDFTPA